MSDPGRVSRLRALIQDLERSSPSEERDAVLERARERLGALELDRQQPSAWRSHGQGLEFPPMKPRPRQRQVSVELTDLALD
jgi:hypothetical protein